MEDELKSTEALYNATLNTTTLDFNKSKVYIVVLSSLLGFLIIGTIIGNMFVIFAILTDRNLRTVGNYLILSLAIADFLVAIIVMPIGAVYEVTGEWTLGSKMCEIWTSLDVLCCTASIL